MTWILDLLSLIFIGFLSIFLGGLSAAAWVKLENFYYERKGKKSRHDNPTHQS